MNTWPDAGMTPFRNSSTPVGPTLGRRSGFSVGSTWLRLVSDRSKVGVVEIHKGQL